MAEKNMVITVPAGSFETSCYRMIFEMFPAYIERDKIRTMDFRYAQNIGLISETLPLYVNDIRFKVKKLIKFI
ncbi:hypothetical protein U2063_15460, partial [Listeria monocytogenes]